jgi:hypothetical protein
MRYQKREKILILLLLFSSVSFLICCCWALEQPQNSSVVEPVKIKTLSQSIPDITSLQDPDQKTVVYLPKTDYNSGEPIEISGSTPLPAGTHLHIEVYTMRWHSKNRPEGKTTNIEKDIIIQNPTDGTDRNFFVSFDSTVLIPGDYYISVFNLDAGSDEEVLLNRTSSPFTIDKALIPTQSGIPLLMNFLLLSVVIGLVSLLKRNRRKS